VADFPDFHVPFSSLLFSQLVAHPIANEDEKETQELEFSL
jgi:hypothetical protein